MKRAAAVFLPLLLLGWGNICLAVQNPTTVSCISGRCHRDISMQRYLHGPIGAGSCDVCHRAERWEEGKHPVIATDSSDNPCYFCHDDVAWIKAQKSIHTPVAKGQCTSCHNPHSAENPFLLEGTREGKLADKSGLCANCHGKTWRFQSSALHQSVALLDCVVCHDPHGSANSYHLTKYVRSIYLRDHLALAEEFSRAKDYRAALDNLRLVLMVEPREVSALFLSARAHLALGEPRQAEPFVDRLVEINPLNAEGFYLKGLVAMALGKEIQAISYFHQSLGLKAGDPTVLLALGTAQIKSGLNSEAAATLSKAVEKEPGNPEIRLALSEAFRQLGRNADADREKALAAELAPAPAP